MYFNFFIQTHLKEKFTFKIDFQNPTGDFSEKKDVIYLKKSKFEHLCAQSMCLVNIKKYEQITSIYSKKIILFLLLKYLKFLIRNNIQIIKFIFLSKA